MKTLVALAWSHPYEQSFTLWYKNEIVSSNEHGYSIAEAKEKAIELEYTHLRIIPYFGKVKTIKL